MEDNKNLDTNIDNKESTALDSKETSKTDVATDKTETTKEKTFTQEDLEKIISKRLERERKKADEEKAEAERLAKMSAEERAKAEFEKEKRKFEEERKSFQKQQLELEVIKELTNKNLPTDFSKYLIAENAETCMENIKTFETEFSDAIEKAVQERLKGGYTPPKTETTKTYSMEDLKNMSVEEINKNWEQIKNIK
ncbi:hypothetical protein K144316041_13500 [Clostridium tetani]|uniref:DUF4355 domain-containing protein n=1 Tax=Clostridium tetani TaxID=1513 RepID=UPI00295342E1|nr:DUF4355 domain-containing protein [Clostridium tetani]BDR72642.1 hypothetical protein K144316041_13500 [Clostridium tetani]